MARTVTVIAWDDGQARPTLPSGRQPHNVRINLTNADRDFLHLNTNVMSNDRMPCTIVLNESEVFYDCGVRLKGSERGRNQDVRVGFNIAFPADQLFFGAHRTIQIDRSGAGNQFSQKEILLRHACAHAGGIPESQDDLIRVIAPKTNPSNGAIADRYAEILQTKLDRPIMTKLDAEEAQRKGVREGEQLAARLITE